MYVWDTGTGELVTGKQYSEPSTFVEWGIITLSGRRPAYQVRVVVPFLGYGEGRELDTTYGTTLGGGRDKISQSVCRGIYAGVVLFFSYFLSITRCGNAEVLL